MFAQVAVGPEEPQRSVGEAQEEHYAQEVVVVELAEQVGLSVREVLEVLEKEAQKLGEEVVEVVREAQLVHEMVWVVLAAHGVESVGSEVPVCV